MIPERTAARFAVDCLANLLDQVVFNLHLAVKRQDPEAVHKLRVSIRRFGQGLRVFKQYVSARESKKVRKQLKRIMTLAGELRNRDVALELLAKAEVTSEDLVRQRAEAKAVLATALRLLSRPGLSTNWRTRLGLAQ